MRRDPSFSPAPSQRPGLRDLLAASIAKLPEMTRADLAVLRVLELHANEDGRAWPSQSRIAHLAGLAVRSVRRALDHLRELGVIAVIVMATPRAPAKVQVAPAAVRGCSTAVLSRADTGVPSERTPARTEQYMEQVPPNPPRGAGAAQASDEGAKPDMRCTAAVDELLAIALEVGPVLKPFAVRMACQAFASSGGGVGELRRLVRELVRQGGGPGLLTQWLRRGWRDVLEDRELRFREAVARKRAPSSTSPTHIAHVTVRTVIDRAAR